MRLVHIRSLLIALALAPVAGGAMAQDMRAVTVPHVPKACIVLRARLAAVDGDLPKGSEQHLDTSRIQRAMDRCASGEAVVLRASRQGQYFLSGPLQLRSGVTLVIDRNTALAAARNPRLYDISPGSCGILGTHGPGCKPLISGDGVNDSGIMGGGSIDGRGGARILGRKVTWWQLAHEAKVLDRYQKVPGLIALNHVRNFTLYDITLRDSPGYHVGLRDSNGFTAWGVKIMTPGTARNTDGIDPESSTNVTIERSFIHAGDDDVAISSGGGVPSSHISILDDHFYTGHGMSIGSGTSGGVSDVLVRNLTIDGAQNGIRIKSDPSRGGRVSNIRYESVCIRNVINPIVLTPHYTNFAGTHIPEYSHITLSNVHILTPGYYIFSGLDPRHVLSVTLDNVFAAGGLSGKVTAQDARVLLGPRVGNFSPQGKDVIVTRTRVVRSGTPLACAARFVPFPALPSAPRLAVRVPPLDNTLYVAADGTGDYYSIQRALDVAPADGAVISVAPGVYREAITIRKPNIVLRSPYEDAAKTVVAVPKQAAPTSGRCPAATVTVLANDFRAQNITLESDSGSRSGRPWRRPMAMALLVRGERDVFDNVRILGGIAGRPESCGADFRPDHARRDGTGSRRR